MFEREIQNGTDNRPDDPRGFGDNWYGPRSRVKAQDFNLIRSLFRHLYDTAGLALDEPIRNNTFVQAIRNVVTVPDQQTQFTWSTRPPVANDIGDKLVGHLWRDGCNEWRLNAGRNAWTQVRGAVVIYNDNTVRAAGTNRSLTPGVVWESFCSLEFHFAESSASTPPIDVSTPITISTFSWGAGTSVIVSPAENSTLEVRRQSTTEFRVVANNTNEFVSRIVGIL